MAAITAGRTWSFAFQNDVKILFSEWPVASSSSGNDFETVDSMIFIHHCVHFLIENKCGAVHYFSFCDF